ncbi:hypothetical protein J3B02_005089 [Coemansia erecta]|nr:hypothetical protein J3B02_005089 [Coemansia erecta]KAJ2873519.1 hypothetical protein FB639_004202 [Coemansia asiatica]
MSTFNTESRVIKAPLGKVWAIIKTMNFSFWSLVKSVESSSSSQQIGSTHTATFTDGTTQVYRVVEFSEINNSLTYEIIDSQPAIGVLSATNRIRVYPVTADDTTFVQWTSDFAAQGSQEAVEDAKYKKLEALSELAKAAEN